MTDLSHQKVLVAELPRETPDRWPFLPIVLVFTFGAAGLLVGRTIGDNADAYESQLLFLLRFMAALKFMGVLCAAGSTFWRFTYPIDRRLALAYLTALVPMAAAPGLIWSLGNIGLGALLFHAGLLAFLYFAWQDDGIRLPGRR